MLKRLHYPTRLRVDAAEVSKRAHRPEVLAYIPDGSFDFAFFPSGSYVAGSRNEIILAGEGEKARVEPYQIAFVFGNGSGEIIEPQLARAAAQFLKGMDVTTHERVKTLAMGELEIHLSAVALDQAEGVQFAWSSVVEQGAKVPQSISKRSPGPGSMRT